MDLTSRTRTEPPPHDLEELYLPAGVEMPENAAEHFLQTRSRAEDIWAILLNTTSADAYKMIFDDHGKMLAPQLRRKLGEVGRDELYFRDKEAVANTVDHYEKLTIAAAIGSVPSEIVYSFATEVRGVQQIIEQTVSVS
jgi:hypothetical protein